MEANLRNAVFHLQRARLFLLPLLESEALDRSECSSIASQINTIENMIEFFEHCIKVGFVDY